MHCLTLKIMFITHKSYSFIWKTIYSRLLEILPGRVVTPIVYHIRPSWIMHSSISYHGYLHIWNTCISIGKSTQVESPFTPPHWYVCLLCHNQFVGRLLEFQQSLHTRLPPQKLCMTAWCPQCTRLEMRCPLWKYSSVSSFHLCILLL